jgi:hypothetical protein
MPLWRNAPTAEVPAYTLVSWAAFEVQLSPGAVATCHVAGEVGYGGQGQVSSPAQEFDPATASFRTRSGRLYRIRGARGLGREGAYVWQRWLDLNDVLDARDVTERFAQAIATARGYANYRELQAAELRAATKGPK